MGKGLGTAGTGSPLGTQHTPDCAPCVHQVPSAQTAAAWVPLRSPNHFAGLFQMESPIPKASLVRSEGEEEVSSPAVFFFKYPSKVTDVRDPHVNVSLFWRGLKLHILIQPCGSARH